MNLLDLILFGIIGIGFILGYKDGFVRKVIGLIGIVLGIYMGVFFAKQLGRMIENIFGWEAYFSNIVAGIAIFLAIILLFSILKRIVHPFDKVNNFFNQVIGGVVGTLQILFFTSAVLFLLSIFGVPKQNIKDGSLLYYSVYNLIPDTVEFVSSYTPNDSKKIRYNVNDPHTIK